MQVDNHVGSRQDDEGDFGGEHGGAALGGEDHAQGRGPEGDGRYSPARGWQLEDDLGEREQAHVGVVAHKVDEDGPRLQVDPVVVSVEPEHLLCSHALRRHRKIEARPCVVRPARLPHDPALVQLAGRPPPPDGEARQLPDGAEGADVLVCCAEAGVAGGRVLIHILWNHAPHVGLHPQLPEPHLPYHPQVPPEEALRVPPPRDCLGERALRPPPQVVDALNVGKLDGTLRPKRRREGGVGHGRANRHVLLQRVLPRVEGESHEGNQR
mmetsp:Transcript_25953/g.62956  ORF Transcript_25953/g.62956 Transcript_25953/m.62956 type:complete len:268 (-) Transcript_25953:455-1258(-)